MYSHRKKEKVIKRNQVRRPPGIRALIIDEKEEKNLLSHEFRYELNGWDYRLPGGKVFETLDDYKEAILKDEVAVHVEKTVPKEVLEEVGIIAKNPLFLKKSEAGSGVTWDLYYFEIKNFEISQEGPQLEEDEVIDGFVWKTFAEVVELCLTEKIHEDRTVAVLLSYILQKQKKSFDAKN